MIRQLAQCPYCRACEIALTDSPELVFNPEGDAGGPCLHLVWFEARYSEWELQALPGRKTRLPRMIGSTEFEWRHPGLTEEEGEDRLRVFLKDLVSSGPGWAFAPPADHVVQPISREQTIKGPDGREHPRWEIEGAAVFAEDAAAFVADIPACQARQGAVWEEPPSFPPLN